MSKNDSKIKLSVLLESIHGPLNADQRLLLEEINRQAEQSKTGLKQAEIEKGICSRKIGAAKKQGQPVDDLLVQIQSISKQIDAFKERLNQLAEKADAVLNSGKLLAQPTEPTPPPHLARKTDTKPAPVSRFHIIEVNEPQAEVWDAFVTQHEESTTYHQYAFRRVIETSFGHHTCYLAAIDTESGNDKSIIGVLPAVQINSRIFGNYLVAVPFFNYGGALANNPDIENALMQAMNKKAAGLGASHVEYRDTISRPGLPQKSEKASLILKLPQQADQLWQDIGTKVRAQIKKADNYNLTFKTGKQELLDDYYQVFATNMRDLGTPVYAKSFFANLLNETSLDARIVVVYRHSNPVSCGFLLSYHCTMEIPWASTLRKANAFNANMFMYWNILKLAIETGHQYFDFGRSSKDAGTFKFKQQWGAQPHTLYWHYWLKNGGELPALNPDNPKFKLAIALWKRMPVWLTKLIGPHLVKNLP